MLPPVISTGADRRSGEIFSAREPYEKAKIQGYLLKRIYSPEVNAFAKLRSRQARNDKKSINNKQKKSTKK